MKQLVTLLFVGLAFTSSAQLTLDSCFSQADRYFRYNLESGSIDESGKLAVKNAGKMWFPALDFEYNSTFQNQQLEFPSFLPSQALEIPLDFHRAAIKFNQNIYDGSISAHKKQLEKYKTESQQYELEIQRIKLKSQVMRLYMGTLLIRQQAEVLKARREVLESQLDRVSNAYEAGVAMASDKRILEAELLTLNQTETELRRQESLLLSQFSLVLGVELDPSVELEVPVVELNQGSIEKRPEILLLRNQINLLEAQKDLTASKRLPKLGVFGSAGLGNPGYNILDPTVQPMALVGIGLRWNIWDWNETRNEKKIVVINQQKVENAIHRQSIQLKSDLKRQEEELLRLDELIQEDEAIVSIRKEVTDIKAAQLENGTATSTDFLAELNKQTAAEVSRRIHQLELIQAKINYNIISTE